MTRTPPSRSTVAAAANPLDASIAPSTAAAIDPRVILSSPGARCARSPAGDCTSDARQYFLLHRTVIIASGKVYRSRTTRCEGITYSLLGLDRQRVPVAAWVGTGHEHPGLGIAHDALAPADDPRPVVDRMDIVPALDEPGASFRRDARLRVNEPIAIDPHARRLDRFLDVHPELEHVEEHLGRGDGDHVPGAVGAGEMGGVLVHEARGMALRDLPVELLRVVTLAFAHRRALAVDPRTLGGRVLLRQESADRDHVAVGIGEPVGGAELHGLDQMMEIVDGVVAEALEVVALEDIEGLEHLGRGERRRRRENMAVSIGDRVWTRSCGLGEGLGTRAWPRSRDSRA